MMINNVRTLDCYKQQLIAFATLESSIVYVTDKTINIVTPNRQKQAAQIDGRSVIFFAIGKHKEIALLYKQNYIQVRKAQRLHEVVHRIDKVNIAPKQDYPLLKLIYDDLYLVYPSSIELISLKGGTRSKYTDLVRQSEFHKIVDLILLNFVDSLRICVLHLRNRLIFTIIPCPITEMYIQDINQVLLLHSSAQSKRTYLAILAQNNHIKIINLINLKQIAEIVLFQSESTLVEIDTDLNCESLMVRYIHRESQLVLKNDIYKINSEAYYKNTQGYFYQGEPFILYHFSFITDQYLSLLRVTQAKNHHVYEFYYFEQGQLCLLQQKIQKNYRETKIKMNCITLEESWKQNIEWREIISTYLQIEDESFTNQQKKLNYSDEARQLEEYYELTQDFDNIISKFTKILAVKSQFQSMNQTQIEEEWEEYLQQIAIDKNLLKETMSLFKLDYQFVKQQNQEGCYIDIQLENCMKDMQERESRIDAKIKEKKEELQQQRKKEKASQEPQKTKLTDAEIKKQQEQYNKFVAEYMAEIEKKRAQEAESRTKNQSKQPTVSAFDPKLKLQLPKLNEQQRKLIASSSVDKINSINKSNASSLNPNKSISQSYNEELEDDHIQQKLDAMLSQIEFQVSPLQKSLQNLIQKVDRIQEAVLTQIKSNEKKLKVQMEVNLEQVVKTSCRGMLSKLSQQIKAQLGVSIKKLYNFEQRSVKQYQKSIQKFKEYAKLQVKHRITLFHQNRKKLKHIAQQIERKQKYQQPPAAD